MGEQKVPGGPGWSDTPAERSRRKGYSPNYPWSAHSNVIDRTISQTGEVNQQEVDRNRRRVQARDTSMKIDADNPPPESVRDQFVKTGSGWRAKGDVVFKDFSKGDDDEKKYKRGGKVKGRGKRDSVKARLTPGEFVVKKSAAAKHMGTLQRMNRGGGGALRNVRSF